MSSTFLPTPVPNNPVILENAIWADNTAHTVGALAKGFAQKCPANTRVALVSDSPLELLAAAAWLALERRDGMVLPAERLTNGLRTRLEEQGFHFVDKNGAAPARPSSQTIAGRVTLLTSGTTGEPKLVEHTWETLFTMARVRGGNPQNWLLTYQPGTYAWFQMVTLWLFVPGQKLTISSDRDPLALFQRARRSGVTAISSTPTLWRLAMLQIPREELAQIPLQQITLGGERVDQAILDQLHALYPKAALTQIYASTEAGACLVVRDGREGFPAVWLRSDAPAENDSPQLQLIDGCLWIRSPFARKGYSGWINSGDRLEIRGDRAIILGRSENAFINVGGVKVAAPEVEHILLQHPQIAWCRVHRCSAPIVGELVGADVVVRAGVEPVTEAALGQFCAQRMAEAMVPRIWKFLKAIPVTDNLKSQLA
jgi:acyl-coenzyme A synthetase/AMP-(fatty) acid ligase